jgi:hypothetical protein
MVRHTRSSGVTCDDPCIADWEQLAAASEVSELRPLVSRYSVVVHRGSTLDTVRQQLARVFPVVSVRSFRSQAVRSCVSALLESSRAAYGLHSVGGSIASPCAAARPAELSTVTQRVHLTSQRASMRSARSVASQRGASGMTAAQTSCAAQSCPTPATLARQQRADAASQAQMSSPGLRSASQPAPAGHQTCTVRSGTFPAGAAPVVPDSRAHDRRTASLTALRRATASQPQQQARQQPARPSQDTSPEMIGPRLGGSDRGLVDRAVTASAPSTTVPATLLSDTRASLDALQQQHTSLAQQQAEVASHLSVLTRILQRLQDAPELASAAAGSAEAHADAPAATTSCQTPTPVTASAGPAVALPPAPVDGHQGCTLAHAPSSHAGRDLVFVGLPMPPVIAGRAYMPAVRAVFQFCSSQLRVDMRPQDLTVRQVFGRTGSRSVVLVRFRSSYVVNSIITAKSVLLDGRSPVGIEFSRSAALRREHSALRRQRRRPAGGQHVQSASPPHAVPSQVSQSLLPAVSAHSPPQSSPVAVPACRSETYAAAPLPDR